jgi:hypothetical protein
MCIICASIPVVAATGAKLNASQLNEPRENRKPIGRITGIFIGLLALASIVYHSLRWPS